MSQALVQAFIVGQWAARLAAEGQDIATGPVVVDQRLWFNETNESRYFLVPGLVVLVMTVLGALLTQQAPPNRFSVITALGALLECFGRCWMVAQQNPARFRERPAQYWLTGE